MILILQSSFGTTKFWVKYSLHASQLSYLGSVIGWFQAKWPETMSLDSCSRLSITYIFINNDAHANDCCQGTPESIWTGNPDQWDILLRWQGFKSQLWQMHSYALGFCCCPHQFSHVLGLGSLLFAPWGNIIATWTSWGSLRGVISSSRVGDSSCQLSRGSKSMTSRASSSLNHIRSVMQAWRSLAALHITWYSPLGC